MRNIISIIIITLIANFTFAQIETAELKTAADKFEQNYNAENFEVIFSMFSSDMQKTVPLDKLTEFLTGLKSQAGNITKREFVTYENGNVALYKTNFERAVYGLYISVDSNSKITGLLVKPFIENDPSEFAYNNLPVQDSIITKKQSDLIFEKTKIFPNQTQISIAIIENGNIKFYGIKRVNDSIFTFDNHNSVFEIGSITKVFTSTLLSNFVIDKKIELDNQINDYINLSLNNNTEISFKQLANHTSGLPRLPSNLNLALVNPENPYKEYGKEKLEEYLTEKLKLSQNQGEKYEYSNLGAGLLGYVLSKIANTSYENLLKTKIFSKYNMTSSTTNRNEIKNRLIKGLNEKGDEVPNWDFSALTGAGSILSTVEDLSKFAIAQFDDSNKELELTRTKTFSINSNMDIGLGWHIIKNKSGTKWNWHNGGTGGYSSSMAIDTKNKNGIIILSNVSAFSKKMGDIDDLCFGLMKTLENK